MTDLGPGERARRVDDARYIGSLNGRYVLASRECEPDASVRIFACRITSITPRRAVLTAPVAGSRGELATAQVEHLGLLKFKVEEKREFGFSALIEASEDERIKLAAKIEWVKKRAVHSCPDQRAHARVIPRNPRSQLLLADGTRLDCFLVDISCSGAAVSADFAPQIGAPLAVGRIVGRVVRHLDVGFAVRFLEQQDETAVEKMLLPCQAASKSS